MNNKKIIIIITMKNTQKNFTKDGNLFCHSIYLRVSSPAHNIHITHNSLYAGSANASPCPTDTIIKLNAFETSHSLFVYLYVYSMALQKLQFYLWVLHLFFSWNNYLQLWFSNGFFGMLHLLFSVYFLCGKSNTAKSSTFECKTKHYILS